MKVAYLINQYPQLSHSFIRREIRALEAHGVEVTRISLRPAGPQVEPADAAEAEGTWVLQKAGAYACLAAIIGLALTRPIRFFTAAWRAIGMGRRSRAGVIKHLLYFLEACVLERHTRRECAEHVHAHFGTNSATVALLCRWLGGPAFSFTVHGPEEFDDPHGLALPIKLREAAFSVAISDFGRSQLLRLCDAEAWTRIHVVRCGVDTNFLEGELTPITPAPRLVCVGRLSEQKGHLVFIQALKRVRDRGIDFEVALIGDGPLRGAIDAELRRSGLAGQVRLLGSQNQSTVREEILKARAFVLPSFAEGLPVVFMEALALGRPVLSTFVAGIPELVVDNVCGWLVPAGSVTRLADALERVLAASPAELATMGRAGRERVARMHIVDREAVRLARLFQSLEESPVADATMPFGAPVIEEFRRMYERV
jgi:colanic acid/amylovoran biosynthesis glycosyltransferase